ncbi:MAG: TolC family protein [Nibricoccus sp.]
MKFFRKNLSFCIALVVGAWACPASAQPAEAKPLAPAADPDEVLRAALPENALPDLKAALERGMSQSSQVIGRLLDLDQARASEKQARSPMLPYASASVGLGVARNRYDYDAYPIKNSNGEQQYDENGLPKMQPADSSTAVVQDLSYNAGMSQPVYHWGALKKNYQSAQLQKAIATRNVEEIRRTLANEIRRAYFNLIAASNALEVEKTTLAKFEEERDFFQKQSKDGFVTASIASSAETRVEDYKLTMQRSRNAFEAQWNAFCDLTGLERGAPIPVFPKEIPAVSAEVKPILPKLAPDPGPYTPINLQNAEDNVRVEKLNYEIAATRLRPKLNMGLNANRGYHSPDTAVGFGGPYMLTSVGVSANVSWAIFDGFSTSAAKQTYKIRQRQQERTRDQAKKDYDETLKTNLTNLRLNLKPLETADLGLTSARDSVTTAQKDYELGVVQKQTVDTYQTYVDSALAAANNARADYYIQIATYLSLRGKDPAVNYRPGQKFSDASKK